MAIFCLYLVCGAFAGMVYNAWLGRDDRAEKMFNFAKDALKCSCGFTFVAIFGLFFI
jgi:hypothetical protein